MATKNLYYCNGTKLIKISYDEETQIFSSQITDYNCGTNVASQDVPIWLNRYEVQNAKPDEGTPIYMHLLGGTLYKVITQDTEPYANVVSQGWNDLELSVQVTDLSGYLENDGAYDISFLHGTGYVAKSPSSKGYTLDDPDIPQRTGINKAAGNYTLSFYEPLTEQTKSISFTINQPACNLLITDISTTPESAPGQNDGEATINATSGNTLEYSLDNSTWQASNVFSGLADGDYTIYVRDTNQTKCNAQQAFSITATPCETAIDTLLVQNESFSGKNDGSVIINATSNREMEYSLDNTNFQDVNEFTNLPAGDYTVWVRDKAVNACIVSDDFTIVAGDDVSIETDHIQCGGKAIGVATVNLVTQGDNAPYEFIWSDGGSGSIRDDLRAGTYTLTITNTHGVSADFEVGITENPPIKITSSVAEDDINITVSGGIPPYSFQWADGPTSQNRTNLQPGTYQLTVTDSNGCTVVKKIKLSPPRHYFSENPVVLELQADNLPTKPNLSFLCKVFVELEYMSGNFIQVHAAEQPADDDGATVFDMQDVLSAYVNRSLPEMYQPGIVREDPLFKRFYFQSQEKYGTPPVEDTAVQIDTFYVLLGGLSFEEYAEDTFFLTYLDVTKPFYTWQPVEKVVLPDQPEYLYFLVNDFLMTAFHVKIKLYFTDDTEEEHTLFSQTGGLNRFEVYSFPAGYHQLYLEGYSCEVLDRYDIWVENQDNILASETRTYILDYTNYRYRKFFLYLNSLGGCDTLACTGKAEYKLKANQQTLEKLLPHDYTVQDAQQEVIRKYAQPEVQVPVGYPEPEMMQALQDFIVSPAVFLWEGSRWIPVLVETDDTIQDEGENLIPFEFTYQRARVDKFTPKLSAVLVPDDLVVSVDRIRDASGENSDGFITLQVSDGTPPYSYLWSNGATTKDNVSIPAGTYSVRVLDSSAPRKSAKICGILVGDTADPVDSLELTANVTHSIEGEDNGSIDLAMIGGSEPYVYNWSNGANTQDISGLAPGSYTVQVFDNSVPQKSKQLTVEIVENPAPVDDLQVSAEVTDASTYGESNGAIELTVFGGTPPYTYAWGHGATTKDIDNLPAGTYNVTVTDSTDPQLQKVVNNIEVGQPDSLFPYFDNGTFENATYADVAPKINNNFDVEIVTNPVFSGTKSLKSTYNNSTPSGSIFVSEDLFVPGLVNNEIYVFKVKIYIPTGIDLSPQTGAQSNDLQLWITKPGVQWTNTFVKAANPLLKDVWQELETRAYRSGGGNGAYQLIIRYPGTTISAHQGEYIYIDDFSVEKL